MAIEEKLITNSGISKPYSSYLTEDWIAIVNYAILKLNEFFGEVFVYNKEDFKDVGPEGTQTGLSTGEGGGGITNPAVQEAYDNVPLDQRKLEYHGECAEADALSKAANKAGVKTLDELKELTKGAESEVWRNDKKMKPMPACPSCAHVQKQLGIKDKCKK